MSAISSVTSGASSPLLQQLQQRHASGSFNRAGFEAQRKADFASALQSAGVDSSKVDDIQKQIDEAVQKVRQNGSGGAGDRDAIKSAVDGVLKDNGVDVAKFQDALKAQHPHRGGRAGGPPPQQKQEPTDSTEDSSTISGKLAELLKSLSDGKVQQGDIGTGSVVDVAA